MLRWLNRGHRETGIRTYQLDLRLIRSIEDLAEHEQRPEEEVAADLLAIALAQRQQAEENLHRWRSLSLREQEVAALVALGYTNREIGERLVISPETVKSHIQNILRKFGLTRKHQIRSALAEWDFRRWDVPSSNE